MKYSAIRSIRNGIRTHRQMLPAAVLALLMALSACGQTSRHAQTAGIGESVQTFMIAEPTYPKAAHYPNADDYPSEKQYDAALDAYYDSIDQLVDQPEGYADGLDPFLRSSIRVYLDGAADENRIYSPLSAYMALALLAESGAGDSREQILTLLGAKDMDALRAQASSVWNANYRDSGLQKRLLSSSLWLRDDTPYSQETADSLAQHYYASVFRGAMGSQAYNKALQSWLNTQTGNLLEEAAAQEKLDAETALAIVSTVCLDARWEHTFDAARTTDAVFHGTRGDQTASYLQSPGAEGYYYWGSQFGAVNLPMETGGRMWLFLPDEGLTPKDLLADDEAMELMLNSRNGWENAKKVRVYLSLPKFDVASSYSLLGGFQALGVTDVLDPVKADFSSLLPDAEGIYLGSANHAVRVAIDEDGIRAASYTFMAGPLLAEEPPNDEVHFTLDRPFLFTVTGDQGLPLFVGIVNNIQ